jgi:KDO2-lipid IV(A) lauroyltransferase
LALSDCERRKEKGATGTAILQRGAQWAETIGIGLFWSICERLSPEVAGRFGAFVGGIVGRLSRRTAIVRRNLEVAFPDLPAWEIEELVRGVWRNAGTVFGEYPHLDTICDPASGRVTISAHPDAPLGVKAVFLSSHVSNWEIGAIAPGRYGSKVTAVYSPRPNPTVNARLQRYRAGLGIRVVPRDAASLMLFRQLKQGNAIGLVADRRDGKGVRVPFFRHMRSVSLVPAQLALKAGAALATGYVRRTGPARYHIYIDRPISVPRDGETIDARAEMMMREVNARYESYIRRDPGNWFCMNRLWPKKVTGAWKDGDHRNPAAQFRAGSIDDRSSVR